MYANRIGKYLPFRWLIQTRDHCSSLNDTSVINATCLTSRTIVSITGDETYDFLQGLVTNDVNVLRKDSNTRMNAIYSLMLNNNGRILYDLLLYDEPKLNNTVNIECDVTIVDQLLKLLKMYKLRKKLEIIDRSEDLKVLAVGFGDEHNVPGSLKTLNNYVIDPRTIVMGYRMLIDRQSKVEDCIENVKMERESQYLKHKYKYGIAEGIKDLPIMKCFPLESNADYLNGVSFHKGCYIGQELTARTHHTGVVRKRIAPVNCPIDDVDLSLIEDGTPIVNEVNKNVGRFRSGKGKFGIATVRLDPVFNAKQLLINFNDKNIPLIVSRPSWWSDLKLKGFNPIQSEL